METIYAFPVESRSASRLGMTLRDYFAAKAMQAILSNPDTPIMGFDTIANQSYCVADEMLKARSKK